MADAKGNVVGTAHVALRLAEGGRWLRDRVGRAVAGVLCGLSKEMRFMPITTANDTREAGGKYGPAQGVAEPAIKGVHGQADGLVEETGQRRAWMATQPVGFTALGWPVELGSGGGFREESGR
jgi:hypothetical protein